MGAFEIHLKAAAYQWVPNIPGAFDNPRRYNKVVNDGHFHMLDLSLLFKNSVYHGCESDNVENLKQLY